MNMNSSANLSISVNNSRAAQIGGADPGTDIFVLEDAELDKITNGHYFLLKATII